MCVIVCSFLCYYDVWVLFVMFFVVLCVLSDLLGGIVW